MFMKKVFLLFECSNANFDIKLVFPHPGRLVINKTCILSVEKLFIVFRKNESKSPLRKLAIKSARLLYVVPVFVT